MTITISAAAPAHDLSLAGAGAATHYEDRSFGKGAEYGEVVGKSRVTQRFTSPDITMFDQNPLSPQSWNLYSYARNNPLIHIDPSGRSCVMTQTVNPEGSMSNGAATAEVTDALVAFGSSGSKVIAYGPADPFTRSFQKSIGMDAIVVGGGLSVTVKNSISLNSAAFHLTSKPGIANPTLGSPGTVNQTIQIKATDPCPVQ